MQNPQRRDSTSYAASASRRLWDRFAEMFGARFYDQFGSEPSEAWAESVGELRPDQVKAALTKIRNSGTQYPPSLPEFLALARSQRTPAQREPGPMLDHFDRFGNIQFLKFLRIYDTTPEQLPALLDRKNEIMAAARNDPEMQPRGEEHEYQQGKEMHEILFPAWRKVINAKEIRPGKAGGFAHISVPS